MKIMMLAWIGVFGMMLTHTEPKIAVLRKLYHQSAFDSSASETFSKSLKGVNGSSDPIFLCYKGAAHMMEAKHSFNPITKLSRFNKGKQAIENAISADPNDLEMRYIRFTIQVNLPAFLGYKDQLQADKTKLVSGVKNLDDKLLRENITNYLIASKKCTKEEIKRLQN